MPSLYVVEVTLYIHNQYVLIWMQIEWCAFFQGVLTAPLGLHNLQIDCFVDTHSTGGTVE